MKKNTLSLLFLIVTIIGYAQVPQGFAAAYLLNNGSLSNVDPNSTYNLSGLSKTGTTSSIDNRKGTDKHAMQFTSGSKLASGQTSTVNHRPLTVSYWVKMDDKTSGSTRLLQFYGNYSGQGATGFRMDATFTATETLLSWNSAMYTNGSFRGYSNSAAVNNLDDGQWHHIIFRTTESGTDLNINVFVDNVQITSLDGTVTTPNGLGDYIRRNVFTVAPLSNFDGAMDDIRIYYSSLNATEIGNLFNEVPPVPRILYVDINATGDLDGTSWSDAFTYLQDAFTNAQAGDEIWIAKGTYKRIENNRNASFIWNKDAISVYGGFVGTETSLSQRDWEKNETILSGDLGTEGDDSDNAYSVLVGPYAQLPGDLINTAYIDGIIIQDGNANASGTNKFGRLGGGFFSESYAKNIDFANCTFRNNTAVAGGGVNISSEFTEKTVTFTNCKFIGNKARAAAPFDFVTFGKNQQITITGCLIAENEIVNLGSDAGLYGHGGRAMAYSGGTIGIGIANTTWANNKDNSSSTEKILLSVFRRFSGGQGLLALQNCIFSNNDHSANNLSYPNISNNGAFTGKSIVNCLLDDTTNISALKHNMMKGDAQFVDASSGNYRLKSTSPAIDKGDATGLDLPSVDLAGTTRVLGTAIDLGCYEYNPSASIRRKNLETVSVYPNPTTGMLYIKSDKHITSISVLNLAGQTLLKSTAQSIDVSDLPSGIYIIQTQGENGIGTARFIKQ